MKFIIVTLPRYIVWGSDCMHNGGKVKERRELHTQHTFQNNDRGLSICPHLKEPRCIFFIGQ